MCDACTSIKTKQNCNERREIESPTRSRPFSSLPSQDQDIAYLKTKYDKRCVGNKYTKLIEKLERDENKLYFKDDSPLKQQL